MSRSVNFHVYGDPQPQGSKKHIGKGRMIESAKGLKPWRKAIRDVAEDAAGDIPWLDGPLRLRIVFYIRRPKHHYRTGRYAGELKPSAPRFCTTTPDTDKLIRAVGDALTGVVYQDDSQVACVTSFKLYGDPPGAFITVAEMRGDDDS